MKKLQSFFVLKFSSSRLKDYGFKINIKLKEARINNEVIRVGYSPLISEIHRITGITSENIKEVSSAEIEIKKMRKKRNSDKNKKRIANLQYIIDKYLFVDSFVYIHFDNMSHYSKIIKNGLFINGEEFVRLISSAGNARQQNSLFIKKSLYEKLDYFIENGRDENFKIGASKYNAYAGLISSAGHKVEVPKFIVIPDYKTTRKTKVDFVTTKEDEEPEVEEKDLDLEFIPFDGMGICSKSYMNRIAYTLDLDYVPTSIIFRSAWMKGMMCSFDFHEFAKIKGIKEVTDIYGKKHEISQIDAILTESQFKMSGAYSSIEQYLSELNSRNYGFWVTRVSPKEEKRIATTNYQYIQCLNLNEERIKELCQPTIDYFKEVSGLEWEKVVLFLMGDIEKERVSRKWFDGLDPLLKCVIYDKRLLSDKFVRNKLIKLISKKIKESYIGVLRVFGNYQVMLSDPMAFSQYAFGLPVEGLLNRGEAYSSFWNKESCEKVSSLRSPMTYRSEINILNLKNSEEMKKWFGHITSGIIYNIFDESDMLHAGSDRDGDGVMTTNNKIFLENTFGGLPVTYERKSAEKTLINKSELWKSDLKVMNNKIGFITNLSTSLYNMLAGYEKNSHEYKLIINRLKNATCQQSKEIDKGKGILVDDIPSFWTKYTKPSDGEDSEKIKTRNELLIDKRPSFFVHLYPKYDREYKKYKKGYETYCISKFGIELDDLLEKDDLTEEQQKIILYYKKYSPLLDNPSSMNLVCWHMEKNVSLIKGIRIDNSWNFQVDLEKKKKMKLLYSKWKELRKEYSKDEYDILNLEIRNSSNSISSNSKEIGRLAMNLSSGFAFSVFPEFVEDLFFNSNVEIPVKEKDGSIFFNGSKYSLFTLDLESEFIEKK